MTPKRRHGPNPKKTASVSLRINPQLKHDLEELAKRNDRSLANFIEHLLKLKTSELKGSGTR